MALNIFQGKYFVSSARYHSYTSERKCSLSCSVRSFVYAVTEKFLHQLQLIQMETTLLKDVIEGRSTLRNPMFFKQCSICLDCGSLKP